MHPTRPTIHRLCAWLCLVWALLPACTKMPADGLFEFATEWDRVTADASATPADAGGDASGGDAAADAVAVDDADVGADAVDAVDAVDAQDTGDVTDAADSADAADAADGADIAELGDAADVTEVTDAVDDADVLPPDDATVLTDAAEGADALDDADDATATGEDAADAAEDATATDNDVPSVEDADDATATSDDVAEDAVVDADDAGPDPDAMLTDADLADVDLADVPDVDFTDAGLADGADAPDVDDATAADDTAGADDTADASALPDVAVDAGADATTTAVPPDMTPLPAGTFMLGTADATNDEAPAHTVTLDAFAIDTTEVTVGDYAAFLAAQPVGLQCADTNTDGLTCAMPDTTGACTFGLPNADALPVTCVDWFQASAYCAWKGRRLPTEAEWEYAATSGGSGALFPWGSDPADCAHAVLTDTTTLTCAPTGPATTCSLGLGNSGQGVCDLAGNVAEWCNDGYGPYAADAAVNPTGATIVAGSTRVVRGGGFGDAPVGVRAAARTAQNPSFRLAFIGFRCAK